MTKQEEIEWWVQQGEKIYSTMLEISWGEIMDLLDEYYRKGLEVAQESDNNVYIMESFDILFEETSKRLCELTKTL